MCIIPFTTAKLIQNVYLAAGYHKSDSSDALSSYAKTFLTFVQRQLIEYSATSRLSEINEKVVKFFLNSYQTQHLSIDL